MVLFSPSSPSRKHGGVAVMARRRRNTSALTVLLLVLSHNVWNTLQCVTSSSQPKNQQIITSVEESGNFDNSGASSFSNDEFFEGTTTTRQGADDNVGFEKKGGQGQVAHSQHISQYQQRRLCSFRLIDALLAYCGANNFYEPDSQENSLFQILGMARKRSSQEVMQRRLTRSLSNDCCKNPCNESTLAKFCHRTPARTAATARTQQQDSEVTEFVQPAQQPQSPDNSVQLAPTSPSKGPTADPVAYSLVQIIDLLQRHFGRKSNPRPVAAAAAEENSDDEDNSAQERDLPLPQARIQPEQNRRHPNPHSHHHYQQQQQNLPRQMEVVDPDNFPRYRSTEEQRYQGNPFQAPVDMEDEEEDNIIGGAGVSFNTNTALPNRHYNTINTAIGGGDSSFDQRANNHLHSPKIKNNYHRHQGQSQQRPRKISSNVLTSTIAPHAILIPLNPSTDDDIPYGKKK